MRFTGKSKLGQGGEAYEFKIGKSELKVLFDVLNDVQNRTPKSLFTQPLTSRVNQMKTEILLNLGQLENKLLQMDKCVICWEEFDLGQELRTLSCDDKHFFHRKCVDTWLDKYSKCPICNRIFE